MAIPPGKKNSNNTNSSQNQHNHQNQKPTSKLSADESYIKSLPLRIVKAGNTEYRGYYDETTLLLYFADENGELKYDSRGKLRGAQLKNPLPTITPDESAKKEKEDEYEDNPAEELKKTIKEKTNQALTNVNEKMKRKPKEKPVKEKKERSDSGKGKKIIIFILIIMLLGALGFGGYMYLKTQNIPIQLPTAPKEGDVMVIEVKTDIVPGEEIKEENLKAASVDSQTFNQISSINNSLYRWEQKDNIIGMYASEFIAQGQYITTNAVTRTYQTGINPWGIAGENMAHVDIPVDITKYDRTMLLIGKKVNLLYQVDKKEDNTSESLEANAPGIEVKEKNSIVTTKMYSIEGATIANIITPNNNNLFDIYSSISKIPEGNQEHYLKQAIKYNKEYISSITPAKIRVIFDKKYVDGLEKVIANGQQVVVELTDNVDTSTTEKKDFYDKENIIIGLLNTLMKK